MKKFSFLSIILLSLSSIVACNQNNQSSSQIESKLSLNPSDYTMNITNMRNYLENTSFSLEGNLTSSATRKSTTIEQQMYAIMTKEVTENLTVYEEAFSITKGEEKIRYKSTDSILDDNYEGFEPKDDTFISYRGIYDSKYHEVMDYGIGKERDTANIYEIGLDIETEDINFQISMQASYFVHYYLTEVFESNYGGNYILTPIIENDNTLTYDITFSTKQEDSYGFVYYSTVLSFNLSLDGFLNKYTYSYQESAKDYDENGVLQEEYNIYSITDECQVTKGQKNQSPEQLEINPSDYWLQTFDIEIIVTDYLDVEMSCDYDAVSCGFYVEARAINIYPEKALDTDLSIVSSSDNSVIEVASSGIVKSLKAGETNLKIVSESGIEKNISLKTFEESIKDLEIKIYATHLFVGDTYGVYEFYTPENAIDGLTWESSDTSIATITVDDNNYASINCLKVGTVTITATSIKDPQVSATVTVRISEKLDQESLTSLITKESWYNVQTPSDVITFNEDGTGSVTFKDFFTEETGTYNFEWIIAEFDETQGLLISITTMIESYNFNVCILSLNGEIMEVYFQMTDPELWFFQYAGDFAQNK